MCGLNKYVCRTQVTEDKCSKYLSLTGLGSILDSVSKILKDTAIFSICTVSKKHFTLRVSYRIFQILHRVKDADTFRLSLRLAHTQR